MLENIVKWSSVNVHLDTSIQLMVDCRINYTASIWMGLRLLGINFRTPVCKSKMALETNFKIKLN